MLIEQLETTDNGKKIKCPDGLIHHWVGVIFIPGATLAQTLALAQDYDHHQDFYKPDVERSRLLRRDGNNFKVFLRFYKKKVLTAILDTEHDVHFGSLDATRAYSRSATTRVAEVENPGPGVENEKPVGHDRGLLWRMNTYWRFQEKDGGTYVQLESISLTRDIPTGLGWLISPFVTGFPREAITSTLGATRKALLKTPATSVAR